MGNGNSIIDAMSTGSPLSPENQLTPEERDKDGTQTISVDPSGLGATTTYAQKEAEPNYWLDDMQWDDSFVKDKLLTVNSEGRWNDGYGNFYETRTAFTPEQQLTLQQAYSEGKITDKKGVSAPLAQYLFCIDNYNLQHLDELGLKDFGAPTENWFGKDATRTGHLAHYKRMMTGTEIEGDHGEPPQSEQIALAALDFVPFSGTAVRVAQAAALHEQGNPYAITVDQIAALDALTDALMIPTGGASKAASVAQKAAIRATAEATFHSGFTSLSRAAGYETLAKTAGRLGSEGAQEAAKDLDHALLRSLTDDAARVGHPATAAETTAAAVVRESPPAPKEVPITGVKPKGGTESVTSALDKIKAQAELAAKRVAGAAARNPTKAKVLAAAGNAAAVEGACYVAGGEECIQQTLTPELESYAGTHAQDGATNAYGGTPLDFDLTHNLNGVKPEHEMNGSPEISPYEAHMHKVQSKHAAPTELFGYRTMYSHDTGPADAAEMLQVLFGTGSQPTHSHHMGDYSNSFLIGALAVGGAMLAVR